MPQLIAVVLAAGKGTRMESKLPKVLHQLAGQTLIDHVLAKVYSLGVKKVLAVVGHGRKAVVDHIKERAEIVVQEPQLGTGHALLQAVPHIEEKSTILVLSGDQPLLTEETLKAMIDLHEKKQASATVLTALLDNPFGYGRIIKRNGFFEGIVEEKDADSKQKNIKEINTGTYCFEAGALKKALQKITPQNAQGEYYLTDVFKILVSNGEKVETYCTSDSREAFGINTRVQLSEAEDIFYDRLRRYWMQKGVTIKNPCSVFIDSQAILHKDVIIEPFTFIKGKTIVHEGAVIGPHTTIEDCVCGKECRIENSVARQAVIEEACQIGPFAYLRPGTTLARGVKIGDFVEIKNSKIEEGSKVPHLSYIGDSIIGKNVNIGAGTITCNYDGKKKHSTIIGDNSFVGSNTNFVAPVEIGKESTVGAGSTITQNVPDGALAVERSQQKIIENWRTTSNK